MPGSDGQETEEVAYADQHQDPARPRSRAEALIHTLSQYQDVYPVLQRGIQFLYQELSDGIAADKDDQEIKDCIGSFIATGALVGTVDAMLANLDSPAFIASCFELLLGMLNIAEDIVASSILKNDILIILDKIVHKVNYQNEPACVRCGINILSKLAKNLERVESGLWTQLVATTAQAMLTDSLDNGLELDCVLTLKLLFQLRTDIGVPATSANVVLKTIDQCNHQLDGVSTAFASAAVAVIFRIVDAGGSSALRAPHLGFSVPVLAAALHQYQLKMDLDDTHRTCVEKLIRAPLQSAVQSSLTCLINLALPPDESHTEAQVNAFQTAAMTLLLSVVWREEARAFLDSGGIAVITNVFAGESALGNTTIETAVAQALYYVSMHWPDETWNEVQINGSGVHKWIEVISDRCEDGNDELIRHLLATLKTLLHCEGFSEKFTESNGAALFVSVLSKRQELPLSAHVVVTTLMSSRVCQPDLLPSFCSLVAESMLALDTNHSYQLECAMALTRLIAQQSSDQPLLSNQHVRDIVRVMRVKLSECSFIGEMLNLVVNALLNSSIRAAFIDRALLQVVSKAICSYQWESKESPGLNARLIICDVAHKLDVTRNLSTIEPQAHVSNGQSFSTQAILTEALDTCCSVVGALAFVKPFVPLLIEEGSIQRITGMLRYAKQELLLRSEASFVQLVTTCFYSLLNVVTAPAVTQGMGIPVAQDSHDGVDGRTVCSQLVKSGADDAVIGCLEEALHVKKFPALLVDGGCQVLQAMLASPIPISNEVESRWIAVVTSILQRNPTQQRTRKLLFATTLTVLSRGKQLAKTAGGQHIKMMKVILNGLEDSIQHESSCTLLQGECTGAIRILEEIAKVSDAMSDALVSRCLGVLGKLTGIFILSPSLTAQDNVVHFDKAIALFATTSYVSRLIKRLERCLATKSGVIDCASMTNSTDDFKALEAILFSSQVRKTVDAYHRIFGYLAAVVENFGAHVEEMGDYASFFLELGCLLSQLLPTAQREEVINTALCQFAESTAWHSMRWIAALADRGWSEFTLVIEFVLLRIVSGFTVLEPALLMELLDALNYLLRCSQCREIVLASSHISELENVLWQLVQADLAHLEAEADGYDVAVSVLGIISMLLSSFSENVFSIHSEENGSDVLVRLCLGTLNIFFSDTNAGLTKSALLEEILQTTGVILQHCIELGAEHVRHITQHRATRHALASSTSTIAIHRKPCQTWCAVVLGAVIQHHGLLYAEKILQLSSDPIALLISLVKIVIADMSVLSWKSLADCVGMVNGAKGWQLDCNELFGKLYQQSKRLVHSQTTVANARRIKRHITDSVACLTLKFGQLTTDASTVGSGCSLKEIAQSGSAFYELFNAAPSFEISEYSAIVSLHLNIARVVGLKVDTDRTTVEDSAVSLRQLLNPICISDEALADYMDLAVALYLSPSVRAAAWQFVDACTHVLSNVMQRLATGVNRSQCLEKSLQNCVSALRTVYGARWESGEVESVLELLRVFSPHKWSQELLLESILVLPQGLLHFFELARGAPSNDVHVTIFTFLFDHVNDIRHKTQRIESGELTAILAVVKQNLAGKVGDTGQRGWRQISGSDVLRAALETLKLFSKRKNCAVLCSDLGGIGILHNVLCAPSQYADIIYLALEIVCLLAGYGANLDHESIKFALQLLFIYVETSEGSSSTRWAYLVLEYFLAVDPSKLNMSLIQQCRTLIIPASARSDEETETLVLQLYITRQKVISAASKPRCTATTSVANESELQMPLSENEILKIISSNCRSIVQVSSEPQECLYVDLNTSEKTSIEPLAYIHLREAVNQLSLVLDDPDMASNRRYVFDLVPSLCEIVVLHTITTPMICQVMQMLDQIAFVHPSVVRSNEELDIPALLASCSLHQCLSLPFARCLARFCNNVATEGGGPTETSFEKFEPLLDLLFELLQNWKLDEEVVDECLSTLRILNNKIGVQCFRSVGSRDSLAVLNTAVLPYIGSSPTAWNWLKCISTIICASDDLVHESIEATTNVVVGIIRMFMSHSFMVRRALTVLACIYQEKRHLTLQHLIDSDGVGVLLTCLKLHANDGWIGRSCLGLLLDIASRSTSFQTQIAQLVAADAAESILLVCKKNSDNANICNMCIEFVNRMLEVFEHQSGKHVQTWILLGDRARKKSELLANLLEADIIPLLFDILDNYSSRGDNSVLKSCLSLLKTLTKDERLCESAEILHGLQELQQTIDRIWETNFDCALVELAIDGFVNMACSDRAIGHGWRDLPMWLLELADSIHKLHSTSTGMSVEKLVGILGRLAVDTAICKTISPKGSFTILELLDSVGYDRSLEQALYGLLCTLSEDIECAQILIVYDAIPITLERILNHIKDESTLLSSLCFFDLLVLNVGESYPSLQDECVFEALELVTQEYPETTGGQIYRIASTILEKVSALGYQKQRIKSVQAKPTPSSSPLLQIPDSEKAFYELLVSGGKFRVLREARPDTVESIQIKLAPSGDYLLFRRKESSHVPRIERVFASQLEVCPQRSLGIEAKSPSSPSKKLLARSILKENFQGDCVLRLKVRDEDVLVKTSNIRERVHWDQALQWLVSRRDHHTSPTHSELNKSTI